VYRHYGDVALLKEHYVGLQQQMAYFARSVNKSNGLLDLTGYGTSCLGVPSSCCFAPIHIAIFLESLYFS
jgi:hypothetical protein